MPNNYVLGIWVIVIVGQFWGKYVTSDCWVLGPLGSMAWGSEIFEAS